MIFNFARLFKGYKYPFKTSDAKLAKMNDVKRNEYYRMAGELLEHEVFVQEMEELIRKLYQRLAVSTTSDLERESYRLTLKSWQDFENRIRSLAHMYKSPSINTISKKL